ncbi:MAG: hypothetical protein H6624_06310 [Bdellovibrionaceae bacterium]|nr:hypothetical protein [Bdellovibrionales bacterium]MCB9083937.1 hypothetical protein [Pseudobdellovibrionaceae bacterium]
MKYVLMIFVMLSLGASAGEHGGKKVEHGGKKVEHGGKKVEHGGKKMEHGGEGMDEDHECTEGEDGESCDHEKEEKGKESKKDKEGSLKMKQDRQVSVEDIKSALTAYIKEKSDDKGIFNYIDADRNNAPMKLKFVKIHDPVRHMEKKGQYFACTDFEVVGQSGKLHDMDFWMVPTEDGMEIVSTKVHKDPVKKSKKWVKVPRYTFQGEEMVDVK